MPGWGWDPQKRTGVVRTNFWGVLGGDLIVQVLERMFWAHVPPSGPLLNPLKSFHRNCASQGLQFPSCC